MPFIPRSVCRLQIPRIQLLLLLLVITCLLLPETARAQVSFIGAAKIVSQGYNQPTGVAVDSSGNVYVIVSGGNQQLKETLQPDGSYTESTLGSGFSFPWGVAVDSSGDVFIPNRLSNSVVELTPSGGSYTRATLSLNAGVGPAGIAVDQNGNLYVSSPNNNSVFKETLSGGSYTTTTIVSGLGNGGPYGVAVDLSGKVYIADTGDSELLIETPSNGSYIQTTAGSGLLNPTGVAVDAQGNVYISDSGNNRLLLETLSNGSYIQTTLASGFTNPASLALDGKGNLYVADDGGGTIMELQLASVNFGQQTAGSPSRTISLPFTIGAGGSTTVGSIAVLTTGAANKDFTDAGGSTCTATTYATVTDCVVNIRFTPLFTGLRQGAVVFYDGSGNVLATVPIYGVGTGPQVTFANTTSGDYLPATQNTVGSGFNEPGGVAIDGAGNIFVADYGNSAVKEILAASGFTTINTLGTGFNGPADVALDGSGNIFVVDSGHNAVKEILAAGGYTTVHTLGSGFNFPLALAVDGGGNVFIADSGHNTVKEILATGGYTTVNTLGSGFNFPQGVAVDGSGNVFVGDTGHNAVKEILAAGGYTTVNTLGSGFNFPCGLSLDAAGDVFVIDSNNNAVKEILADGGYTTVNTLETTFNGPQGVTVDEFGNVFVADLGNNVVDKLNYAMAPTLTFATPTPENTTDTADGTQTVTLANIGNASLTLPVPVSGSNPSIAANFTLNNGVQSACPLINSGGSAGTLGVGASCLLPIGFSPEAIGSLSGSLTLTDNALNAAGPAYAVQSIALNGTGAPAPAVLISPAPGSVVGTSNVQFSWTTGTNVTYYQFALGTTGPGSSNLYYTGWTAGTSVVVPNVPGYGVIIYARLYSRINNAWQFTDYTYTESGSPTPSVLNSPTVSTVLGTSNVNFAWTTGSGVTYYQFALGTTGAGSSNLYYSGWTTATSAVVPSVPQSGVTVYARLYSRIDGAWQFTDYTYTESGAPTPAVLTSPTAGTVVGTSNVTFGWTSGTGVSYYQFALGTTGPGASDLYYTGWTTSTSVVVPTVPANGATIYARLYSRISGAWQFTDYTYTESGTAAPAVLTTPAPGLSTVLASSNVTFGWTAGTGVTYYEFALGTTGAGASNLYLSGWTTNTSVLVPTLPTNGVTVYARLLSRIDGAWQFTDYVYTAQ